MTANQIAYQANVIREKQMEADRAKSAAQARLLDQQRETEKYQTNLQRLDSEYEQLKRGDYGSQHFYSALDAAKTVFDTFPLKFSLKL